MTDTHTNELEDEGDCPKWISVWTLLRELGGGLMDRDHRLIEVLCIVSRRASEPKRVTPFKLPVH
jgi:hypothetical protein